MNGRIDKHQGRPDRDIASLAKGPWTTVVRSASLVLLFFIGSAAAQSADPPQKDTPAQAAPPADPLRGLERFPHVIVVPKEGAGGADLGGSILIDQKVLDDWLADRVDGILERLGAASTTRGRLTITLDASTARLEADIEIRVISNKGTQVRIDFREASLNQVTLQERRSGKTAEEADGWSDPVIPSVFKDDNGYSIQLEQSGEYRCHLDGVLPVNRFPKQSSLTLSLAGLSEVQFRNSGPMQSVRNTNSGVELGLSEDRRTASITTVGAEPLRLTWHDSTESGSSGEITSVEGLLQYRVETRALHLEATLDLLTRGDVRTIELGVPSSARILEVLAFQADKPLQSEFEVVEADGGRRLILPLPRGVSGEIRLRIVAESEKSQQGELAAWTPSVQRAREQSGTLLLYWPADLWVRPQPQVGTERIRVNDLPLEIQRLAPRQAYHYGTAPGSLPLIVEVARPALSSEARHELRIGAEKAELLSRFVVRVRGAQAGTFTIRVPSGLRVLEARPGVASMVEEQSAASNSDVRLLVVTLSEPVQDSDVELLIRGELPVQTSGSNAVVVPSLESEEISVGTLAVHARSGVRLTLDDARSEYLHREPAPRDETPTPVWFFRLQSGSSILSFTVERLEALTEVAVESEVLRVGEELQVRTNLRYRSMYASFDEVSIAIPERIEDLVVTGHLLDQKSDLGTGTVTLRLSNPTQSCDVRVSYRYPLPEDELHQLQLPLVLPRRAVISSFRSRIFCDRGWRAVVLPPWTGSRPAPEDVISSGERPDLDIRLLDLESSPETMGLRFEPTTTLATLVIPRVAIEEISASGGRRWGRKRWLIAKHRTRDVSFEVPPGCNIRMAFVNGRGVEPVADASRQFRVRLPAVDEPCSLEVDYEFPQATAEGAAGIRGWTGPTLMEDAAVEQVRWVFRVADDRLLARIGSSGTSDVRWTFPGFLKPSQAPDEATADWLSAIDPDVEWASLGLVASGGRTWQFETFGQADTLALVSLREPFWILVCSGASFVFLLAMTRLPPITQLRIGLVLLLALVGLLAAAPDLLGWLWLGGQWGVYVGILAIALHYGLLYRRVRAYGIGLRRLRQRPIGLGSSLLRRLDPKTRVTTAPAPQEA